jgi:hypothetical protein
MQYPHELQEPPHSGKSFHEKSKGIAAIITAGAALVTSLVGLVRSSDTSVEKKSYEALSANIETLSEDNRKNHDAIEAIRVYLDEDRDARIRAQRDASSARPPSARSPLTAPPRGSSVPVASIPVPPPPPPAADQPQGVSPQNFDSVVRDEP